MSWGAPLGFSSGKSPFELISSAAQGEVGWFVRMQERPVDDFPQRTRLTTPCATATFLNEEDAQAFVNHPGDIAELARRYISWARDGNDPREGDS